MTSTKVPSGAAGWAAGSARSSPTGPPPTSAAPAVVRAGSAPAPRPDGVRLSGDRRADAAEHRRSRSAELREIPIDAIAPNPQQPRQVFDDEALAELEISIREVGLLQPIVVAASVGGRARYELVMGERRLAGRRSRPGSAAHPGDRPRDRRRRDAARRAAGEHPPRPAQPARRGGGLPAAARGVRRHARGARRPDRPQPPVVSNTIRLLKLPAPVQRRVAAGVLSAGHARALLGLDDAEAQEDSPPGSSPRACRCAATEEAVRCSPRGSRADKPAPGNATADARARDCRISPTGCRTASTPGSRSSSASARAGSSSSSPSVDDLERIVAQLDGPARSG